MAWVLLSTITPSTDWQFTQPLQSGICRLWHQFNDNDGRYVLFRWRVQGLIGIGSNLAGLIQISDVQRFWLSSGYTVYRFNMAPELELTCVGLRTYWELSGSWQVKIEEWV